MTPHDAGTPGAVGGPVVVQRGRISRDGESIYYELCHREGLDPDQPDCRPVVVLTHGAGGSHAAWFNQILALSERYRVLTWDSRGFGNSTCRCGTLSAPAAVADLDAVLVAAGVGLEEAVHLVGQSMGGWWVTVFAMTYPARVRSLTLSDTPGGVWTPALREHFASFRRAGGLRSEVVGRHPALGATTMRDRPTLAWLYQQLGSFHDPPMAEVGRVITATLVDPAALRALGLPMLVIAGEEDAIFPAPLLGELAGLLEARFVELAGVGHSPYFEAPQRYNDALLAFLA